MKKYSLCQIYFKHTKLNFLDCAFIIYMVDYIEKVCSDYNIKNWRINKNNLVDVDGDVCLSKMGITNIPIKFGKVEGNFNCSFNKLESLFGAPGEVGGDFDCSANKLKSIEFSPIYVGGDYNINNNRIKSLLNCPHYIGQSLNCHINKLESLEGVPHTIYGDFNCHTNNLKNLIGSPREVGGSFYCSRNKIINLEGAPRYVGGDFVCNINDIKTLVGAPIVLGGDFYCGKTPVDEIWKLFDDYSFVEYLNDYDVIAFNDGGTSFINIQKLKSFLCDVGKSYNPLKMANINQYELH
jgi:hypothetical protein